MNRRHFLSFPLSLPFLLAACGGASANIANTPFVLATDRPTFIFFYAQG